MLEFLFSIDESAAFILRKQKGHFNMIFLAIIYKKDDRTEYKNKYNLIVDQKSFRDIDANGK